MGKSETLGFVELRKVPVLNELGPGVCPGAGSVGVSDSATSAAGAPPPPRLPNAADVAQQLAVP